MNGFSDYCRNMLAELEREYPFSLCRGRADPWTGKTIETEEDWQDYLWVLLAQKLYEANLEEGRQMKVLLEEKVASRDRVKYLEKELTRETGQRKALEKFIASMDAEQAEQETRQKQEEQKALEKAEAPERKPRRWTKLIWPIIAAVLVLALIFVGRYAYQRNELYHIRNDALYEANKELEQLKTQLTELIEPEAKEEQTPEEKPETTGTVVQGKDENGPLEFTIENGDPMDHYTEGEDFTSRGTPINRDFDLSAVVFQETPSSSAFSKVGYIEEDEVLVVVFRSTGPYKYEDVPYTVWEEFTNADSLGSYYNYHIKGEYPCEKIETE